MGRLLGAHEKPVPETDTKHFPTASIMLSAALLTLISVTAGQEQGKFTNPAVSKSGQYYESCLKPGTVALTFDDGPLNTPQIVSKLKQLNIIATFFINGQNYPEAYLADPNGPGAQNLKVLQEAGHQIATHGLKHMRYSGASFQAMWDDLKINEQLIKTITGRTPVHFRAPYLEGKEDKRILNALDSWGYSYVGVNLDTKDTVGRSVAAQRATVSPLLTRSNAVRDSFITLNHDHTPSLIEWLDVFVPMIRAKGFTFVTTEQCIGKQAYKEGFHGGSTPAVTTTLPVTTTTLPTTIVVTTSTTTAAPSPTESSNSGNVENSTTSDSLMWPITIGVSVFILVILVFFGIKKFRK